MNRRADRWIVITLWLALFPALTGCAALVSKGEYRAYREVRLAPDLRERLRAGQKYVTAYPHGRWSGELLAAHASEEASAFETGKDTREGLDFYLEIFPQGTFASQARSRLQAVGMIEQQQAEAARRAAQAAEERLAREREAQRTWVSRFTTYWIRILASLSNWGAPIAEVAGKNPEFSRAFGRAPRPRCTKLECVKYYTAHYAIPIPGSTRLERTLQLIMRLGMDARTGRLARAELLIPGWGFSRWSEVEQRRMVIDGDPEQRTAAVAWAMSQLEPAVRALAAGGQLQVEPAYLLAAIAPPAVGPSGEVTDTTVENPSLPGNRIQDGTRQALGGQRDISGLLAGGDNDADMVVGPIAVGGEESPGTPQADEEMSLDAEAFRAEAAAESSDGTTDSPDGQGQAGELVLDAIAVPGEGAGGVVGQAVITELPQTAETPSPPATVAYRVGNLRVVLFAAGGAAAAPAYDGVLIEPVTPGARPPPVAQ